VWSGFLIAIGVMLLLGTLGVAIGVSTVGPGTGADARALGVGAAIWAGLVLLLAVFVGGMVAARLGLIFDGPTSALHGALVWVLAMLAVLYLATSGISLGVNELLGGLGGADADRAAAAAQATSWTAFAAMLVSLAAAIAGGVYGGRRVVLRLAGV
jgi:hypothetical protein